MAEAGWVVDIEEPMRLASADALNWSEEADLVVVGYGGAGVSAAIEARELGLSVIAIDRFSGGGATRINGGVFYGGGGTAAQKEARVEDTPEEMFRYLKEETQGVVNEETLRRFCETSAETADWLTRHGVVFQGKLYDKKTSYPHTDYSLYHPDNSLAPFYKSVAKPAARGHRAHVDKLDIPMGYGKGLYDPLRASADRAGVRFIGDATVRQLITGPDGRVLGVKLVRIPVAGADAKRYRRLRAKATATILRLPPTMPGAPLFLRMADRRFRKARAIEDRIGLTQFVRARRGVCLSAGGFIFNREMVARCAPKYLQGMPLGTPGDDGSGIRLGQSVGAAVDRLSQVSAWRFINPPIAWAKGLIVGREGRRYVNEMLYGASIGRPMVEEHAGVAWIILDSVLRHQAWEQAKSPQMLPFQKYPALLAMKLGSKKARSLPELAKRCGIVPAALVQEVERYNRMARGEIPDPFGKAREDIAPIEHGPFCAVNMSIDAKLAALPVLTLGGLKVDERTGAVLDDAGRGIPGLYAAGRTAIGVCSNIYVSGLSVADCVFSGRRAARSAARPL